MKRFFLPIAFLCLGPAAVAQETSTKPIPPAYLLERDAARSGLTQGETQTIRRALDAIDRGRWNAPRQLFVLDGDTVWVREVEPNSRVRPQARRTIDVDIDGGVKLDLNRSGRLGKTNINVRSIKIGPGVVGFVIGSASSAYALCAYLNGCSPEAEKHDF
ncbi:hypothetical protein [Roseobacter sinensis]|uniref:Uncharacterized protein n=1 Tax=Roseobacter sinensis TaxID=2931391 RepID=A0ABT3B8G9_9RHOB|nr:hypothetical protein [Roseobacter sp. WL0113]MCV3269862.1 hypothetical protein [Roseobacter sp. WL0113]